MRTPADLRARRAPLAPPPPRAPLALTGQLARHALLAPLALLALLALLAACAELDPEGEGLGDQNDKSGGRPRVAAEFRQSAPMSDEFFNHTAALSGAGVQAFLERSPYGRSWLAAATFSGQRAADVVYAVAQEQGLNPILLLSRMQTESSLISAAGRPAQHLIDRAMGCGCPDGYACASRYLGFRNQLTCAAQKLRELYSKSADGSGWWRKGLPNTTLDNYRVTPQSHATAALYAYTPWVLVGSGGTWLAWRTARLFDEHVAAAGHDRLGGGGGPACGRFFDVPGDHPGFGAVEAAVDLGYVSGCDGAQTAFCPDDSLTRAQAATILVKAFALPAGGASGLSDARGHWGEDAVDRVVAAGLMSGCGGGRFCPDDPMSRAAAAVVLAKAAGVSGGGGDLFSDLPSDHWATEAVVALYDRGDIGACAARRFCPDEPARRWIFTDWLINVLEKPRAKCE
ncbi:MAG: S-layer homology domain-containing protein [Deltaproteobacteria bacterium]|nr:S-layer homology domain-containing protein [Deltaproteobacteria bacterium]